MGNNNYGRCHALKALFGESAPLPPEIYSSPVFDSGGVPGFPPL